MAVNRLYFLSILIALFALAYSCYRKPETRSGVSGKTEPKWTDKTTVDGSVVWKADGTAQGAQITVKQGNTTLGPNSPAITGNNNQVTYPHQENKK